MFTAAFFITAKVQKQLKCPSTDEWIKKKCNKAKQNIASYACIITIIIKHWKMSLHAYVFTAVCWIVKKWVQSAHYHSIDDYSSTESVICFDGIIR